MHIYIVYNYLGDYNRFENGAFNPSATPDLFPGIYEQDYAIKTGHWFNEFVHDFQFHCNHNHFNEIKFYLFFDLLWMP